MLIKCGYDIGFEFTAPTPLLLMINVRPERQKDLKTPETLRLDPVTPNRLYIDRFGNICTRLLAPQGRLTLSTSFVIEDSGLPDAGIEGLVQHPVDELPDDVIVYLLGSRYCETDVMSDLAWSLFGGVEPGWKRAQAILDYAHQRIKFDYMQARSDKTAWNAHEEQLGVCRDYTHLAITLFRCMNIPARYCTGYMGDIGIPVEGEMDFSAWTEIYLSGKWHTVDARHNKPRIGRILMAQGRDATDAAISTAFGSAKLVQFDIVSDEVTSV